MKPKKTFYYADERNDDFAGNSINTRQIGDDFVFVNKHPFWRMLGVFFYRGIATPVAWFTCRIIYGVRIKNRRALRHIDGGYFLYGNHTQSAHDAFAPSLLTFPRKCYIVTSPDAVSIPGLRQIVMMLGALPMPGTLRSGRNFLSALELRIRHGNAVTIYPEAHIWPYYTGLRDFPDDSFSYPVRLGVPAVAFAVTYRHRRIFKSKRPLITIYVSQPFYPDGGLSQRAARAALHSQVCGFMREHICVPENAEYIRYVRQDKAAQ